MTARKLPDGASSEIESANKFVITDTGRTYRDVNRDNRRNDGMNDLNKADPGFNSKITGRSTKK